MGVLSAFLSVHRVHAVEATKGRQVSWDRITDGFELPCGSWKLNPGPLQEQPDALNC